jgi:pimeloyl-ACP methyl ester carboxylesterase
MSKEQSKNFVFVLCYSQSQLFSVIYLYDGTKITITNLKFCREKSYWDLLENPPQGMEIVIVRAEKSDRWDEEAIERIQKLASQGGTDSVGKVSFCVLPNAGHWVHVDNPKGLLEIVASKMASL